MSLEFLKAADPQIYEASVGELRRQNEKLELIASENFPSVAVIDTFAGAV